jgi:hypothetical protein
MMKSRAGSRAEDALLDRHSMMEDDWTVEVRGTFASPMVPERPGQTLLFGERIRNGSISADITILDSAPRRRNQEDAMEATLIARYTAPGAYYYAGTGAFGAKFFIGKVLPGPIWQARLWAGEPSSLVKGKKYRLRLEFAGSQITLFENDVLQFTLIDDSYQSGQCGLASWRTSARFESVRIERATPRAFVIMPFTTELSFVHGVMQRTVESYGIECLRADEIALSRPVMEDVKAQIAAADLVIVDFTGKNPNVYYEAGLADAWKKDWIVLAQSSEDMTFDVRHIRSIRYTNTMGADVRLADELGEALEALGYRRPAVGEAKRGRDDDQGGRTRQSTGTQEDTRPRRRRHTGANHRGGTR